MSDREHVLPINSSKIPKIEEPSSEKIIPVRRSDLDMNKHVNNARYLEWMEEPLNEGQIYRTNKVDIIFLRESVYGDTITSQIKATEQASTFHQLKNQRDEIIALASFSDI